MLHTADYHFDLPRKAIAQVPASTRDGSKLLVVETSNNEDRCFRSFLSSIPKNAVVVVNDTKVIRARLRTRKEASGGSVELLLLEPIASLSGEQAMCWKCLAKSSKKIMKGTLLVIGDSKITCKVVEPRDQQGHIVVQFSGDVYALLESHGELPLPPYIERPSGDTTEDRQRYQTRFAKAEGAVAAPTAGLHFTDTLLREMKEQGHSIAPITLHVGLGTFAPVRVSALKDIVLHEERYTIPSETASLIASGRPIVAIGTTVVRALESAAQGYRDVRSGFGRTSIFISPGYKFQVVDHLLTNFHLPGSTLLMLVCAFAGYERVMEAYQHALSHQYRFYSYGDAMLLSKDNSEC